jgi:hypothetical protein
MEVLCVWPHARACSSWEFLFTDFQGHQVRIVLWWVLNVMLLFIIDVQPAFWTQYKVPHIVSTDCRLSIQNRWSVTHS